MAGNGAYLESRFLLDEYDRMFLVEFVRNRNDSGFQNRRMFEDDVFYHGRGNVIASEFDQFLQAIDEEKVASFVVISEIAGVEPA